MRDLHTELIKAGLDVAGVSPQGPESHRDFRAKYKLPFTLLSDSREIRHPDVRAQRSAGARGAAGDLPHRPGHGTSATPCWRTSASSLHEAFIRRAGRNVQAAGQSLSPGESATAVLRPAEATRPRARVASILQPQHLRIAESRDADHE